MPIITPLNTLGEVMLFLTMLHALDTVIILTIPKLLVT